MMTLTNAPIAKAEMLIRRPAAEVFEAFVDPAVTTRFWFTKSSGRLEAGKRVRWDWEMYGVGDDVHVKEIEAGRRIRIQWISDGTETEWTFSPRSDSTFVVVTHEGFKGDGDAIVKAALDSTQGFTIALCGLKALLEHGLALGLVQDTHPDALVET
jgi:uncharacterized protein YndB with AHSA1/START domain